MLANGKSQNGWINRKLQLALTILQIPVCKEMALQGHAQMCSVIFSRKLVNFVLNSFGKLILFHIPKQTKSQACDFGHVHEDHIYLYTCVCVCVCVSACMHAKSLQSCSTLCDPRDWACQVPLSMGFSRQDTRVGCHALLQGIFPTQGSNSHFFTSPSLAGGFFTISATQEVPSHCDFMVIFV